MSPSETPSPAVNTEIAQNIPLPKIGPGVLVLDYDGTLVPLASTPQQACPDAALMTLMEGLCARGDLYVHVVSGRPRQDLEQWFGRLRIGLHAEHGAWSKWPGGGWQPAAGLDLGWMPAVSAIMSAVAERIPGTFVEVKSSGLAWHYRLAEPSAGSHAQLLLIEQLQALLSTGLRAEILLGLKVVEVRCAGVTKGSVVAPLLAATPAAAWIVAAGDDRTDEDLFAQLPSAALVIRVGGQPRGHYWMADPSALRVLLTDLITTLEPSDLL